MVPLAGWGAAGVKFGKWGTKADDFFKKLFGKNTQFPSCARSAARAMTQSISCPSWMVNMGNDIFMSPAGLVYLRESATKHRIDHIMDHTKAVDGKPLHGVFIVKDQDELLKMIDDAWKKGGEIVPTNNKNKVTRIDYDEAIGEGGEKFLCVVTRVVKKKDRVITAYPSSSPDCPRH
ncbi:hypothetical protein DDQ41_14605 [Streptomyces spongiicola]|uniref:Bacterial CdiA-CT RNAse A domain-containing protein n=2 Tax=Streptomyces spongiicola TaxID=1690221 RepID=A0ABN5KKK9_9ACTN|nr:hypothetical protein DDQ41_14605 [Streptomyces spongiicola]